MIGKSTNHGRSRMRRRSTLSAARAPRAAARATTLRATSTRATSTRSTTPSRTLTLAQAATPIQAARLLVTTAESIRPAIARNVPVVTSAQNVVRSTKSGDVNVAVKN